MHGHRLNEQAQKKNGRSIEESVNVQSITGIEKTLAVHHEFAVKAEM